MRRLAAFLVLAPLLAGCNSPAVQTDLAKITQIINQVKAGGTVALADAQAALPYVCGSIALADGAFKLFDKNASDISWEAAIYASIQPICAPGYQITDPTADLKVLVNAWQQIAARASAAPPASP